MATKKANFAALRFPNLLLLTGLLPFLLLGWRLGVSGIPGGELAHEQEVDADEEQGEHDVADAHETAAEEQAGQQQEQQARQGVAVEPRPTQTPHQRGAQHLEEVE